MNLLNDIPFSGRGWTGREIGANVREKVAVARRGAREVGGGGLAGKKENGLYSDKKRGLAGK